MNCGNKKEDDALFCSCCGARYEGHAPMEEVEESAQPGLIQSRTGQAGDRPATRYKALRILIMVQKVLAWIVAGGCILVGVFLGQGWWRFNPVPLLMGLLFGAFVVATVYVAVQRTIVVLDTEENTRKTCESNIELIKLLNETNRLLAEGKNTADS